jgi:hypothetical protein
MNLIDCKKVVSRTLTINFFIHGSIGMEDIECMNKFLKFNNTIFLFIKKIKNLEKNIDSDYEKIIIIIFL